MHHANLNNSDRLKRVLKFLKDKQPHTTRDIIKKAHVCSVSSIVSELRSNGFNIGCNRKGQRWYYQLV